MQTLLCVVYMCFYEAKEYICKRAGLMNIRPGHLRHVPTPCASRHICLCTHRKGLRCSLLHQISKADPQRQNLEIPGNPNVCIQKCNIIMVTRTLKAPRCPWSGIDVLFWPLACIFSLLQTHVGATNWRLGHCREAWTVSPSISSQLLQKRI